jgi:hypothetical protein
LSPSQVSALSLFLYVSTSSNTLSSETHSSLIQTQIQHYNVTESTLTQTINHSPKHSEHSPFGMPEVEELSKNNFWQSKSS